MYQASVPALLQTLGALSAILDKAVAYAEAKKIDPSVLINARLAPDMLPFVSQIRMASDHAKGMTARLAGREVPKLEDNEATFDDLKARIAKTVAFVKSVSASEIDGSEDRAVTMTFSSGRKREFTGQGYLVHFALPNFYFHVTTAYDILRHNGLDIGKRDFMGPQ